MKLTLDAAAKQVGTSKSTLLRAIRSGVLSAERMGDRAFRVDESELSRWQQSRANDAPSPEPGRATAQHDPAPDAGHEAEAWRVRVEAAERMLAQAEATVADLRARLDAAEAREARLQAEASDARAKALDSLTALLPRLLVPPEKPPEAPAVTSPLRRWWPW